MNMKYQKKFTPPPPPHFLIRSVLLCFLFLTAFLAIPVQSQTRLTNPTAAELAPCGLPAAFSRFNSSATVTTFNMTADCTIDNANVGSAAAFLWFESGAFTINGNGHSIIGPSSRTWTIFISGGSTVLNLNDVTLRGNEGSGSVVNVGSHGTLNASNVIFRNNTTTSGATATLTVQSGGHAFLEDVQFLDNRGDSQIVSVISTNGTIVTITNGVFRRNVASGSVLQVDSGATIELEGCLIFDSNTQPGGEPLSDSSATGASTTFTDNSDPATCPKPPPKRKKKEEARPTPTPTLRPAYGASYVALQTATGMTFEATYGLDSGVHFRQLDGAGIGVQSIIDAGYLAALDVYGYVEQGVEVCFPQIGRVIFLDARTMPRAITPLESTVVNGMTCASISSPGSLVLMPN